MNKTNLQYGDIILFEPTTFYGKCIKNVDGGNYSHVGMFISTVEGIPLFIESHEKKDGVVISRLEYWKNYKVLRAKDMKPVDIHETLSFLGKKYGTNTILRIILSKIFNTKIKNDDDTELICSETIDRLYKYKIGGGYVATPRTFEESPLLEDITNNLN